MKMGDKEIDKKLQGHGKTNFKEQMCLLIFVLFTTRDTITIYYSIASVLKCYSILGRWVNCADYYLLLDLCKCIDIADSTSSAC